MYANTNIWKGQNLIRIAVFVVVHTYSNIAVAKLLIRRPPVIDEKHDSEVQKRTRHYLHLLF